MVCLTSDSHFYCVTCANLRHAQYLTQIVAFGIQSCTIVPHTELLLLVQIQIQAHIALTGDVVGVGHGAAAAAGGEGGVAGYIFGFDLNVAGGGDAYIAGRNGTPHRVRNAGGLSEELILEGEGSVVGSELHTRQIRISKETQGQIGIVFQQGQSVFFCNGVEIGVIFNTIFPIHHIFEVEEEITHGAAFFIAVSVPTVVGSSAQSLHEFGVCHIGGAGEGGDAIVAVERAVVEGLGMGHFCAVEQILTVVQLGNLLEQGGSGIFLLGIIIVGNGKAAEEQGGVQHQLQRHRRSDHGSALASAVHGIALMDGVQLHFGQIIGLGGLQCAAEHIEMTVGGQHAGKINAEEAEIIHPIEYIGCIVIA